MRIFKAISICQERQTLRIHIHQDNSPRITRKPGIVNHGCARLANRAWGLSKGFLTRSAPFENHRCKVFLGIVFYLLERKKRKRPRAAEGPAGSLYEHLRNYHRRQPRKHNGAKSEDLQNNDHKRNREPRPSNTRGKRKKKSRSKKKNLTKFGLLFILGNLKKRKKDEHKIPIQARGYHLCILGRKR